MKFIRLNITVEGQAEEAFVKNALTDHLGKFNISTDVRRVLTSKDSYKSYRGGLSNYEKAKNDISAWLKENKGSDARFSTMFDFYRLPKNFPKYDEAQKFNNPYDKVAFLECALKDDIGDYRFIPYIQLHEFEALVLAKPENLGYEYLEHGSEIAQLAKLVEKHNGNPELINEGQETAPSKRIAKLIPEYDKVSAGSLLASMNGIDLLTEKCPHFNAWVKQLENLPQT